MPRDRVFERRWLDERGKAGQNPAFTDAVVARLERATAELGEDSFTLRTLRELCIEVEEEALDIAGWGVLAMQLPPPATATTWGTGRARHLLDLVANLAAEAAALAREAASHLPPDTNAPA